MAIQDTTVPYEILIRFDREGNLQGAHKIERRTVVMDGEVLKDEPGDAIPLEVGADGTVWGVLNEAQTIALATATSLQGQLAAANAEKEDLYAAAAAATDELQQLKALVAKAVSDA
ncbi:MAG TPA: hypothetical protein VLF67_01065 [Candidatus Saccharimonas sp.]|nr:hypothetical protein [Candidatus Saccharimonas sp.]